MVSPPSNQFHLGHNRLSHLPTSLECSPGVCCKRDTAPAPTSVVIPRIEARAEQKPTTEKSATCLKCGNGKCCKRGLVAVAEPTPLVVRGWIVEEEEEGG